MAETILRPNGKSYRPRKVVAHAWENDDWPVGVVIIGTHDLERAGKFAEEMCQYWYGLHATKPSVDWFRDGFESGKRVWVRDPNHGRAGVMFTASDEPGGKA